MVFSVGLLDSLFGERITVEVPNSCGNLIKRSFTKKWMELVQEKRHWDELDKLVVNVHLLDGSKGYRIVQWFVGDDISKSDAAKLRDVETGDLYAIYYVEDEEPKIELINRSSWEIAYNKIKNA